MKTKRLLSVISFVAVVAASNGSFAQVKIGANPTTISTGAHLDVESSSNTHTVVAVAQLFFKSSRFVII